jgi:hypothetical protein
MRKMQHRTRKRSEASSTLSTTHASGSLVDESKLGGTGHGLSAWGGTAIGQLHAGHSLSALREAGGGSGGTATTTFFAQSPSFVEVT